MSFNRLCKLYERSLRKPVMLSLSYNSVVHRLHEILNTGALFQVNKSDLLTEYIPTHSPYVVEYIKDYAIHQPFPFTIIDINGKNQVSLILPDDSGNEDSFVFCLYTQEGIKQSLLLTHIRTYLGLTEQGEQSFYIDQKHALVDNHYNKYRWTLEHDKSFVDLPILVHKALLEHIEVMQLIMTPTNFIIEECPLHSNYKNKKKIPRSNNRPKYTYLTIKEIHKRYKLTGKGTGCPLKQGHPRRRHKRTYTNDRYTFMKGKTVDIPAVWIGPKETQIGNKIYRVCINL